jgi:hypothetical protein
MNCHEGRNKIFGGQTRAHFPKLMYACVYKVCIQCTFSHLFVWDKMHTFPDVIHPLCDGLTAVMHTYCRHFVQIDSKKCA